jgi:hypothetical protein
MARVVVLVAAALAAVSASDVTPIQKVLQMMEDMLSKGKAMKHEEETEFAAFHQWCDDLRSETERNIKEGADEIEQLSADIAKGTSDAEVLSEEVADLQKEIGTLEAEVKSATAVRAKEQKVYAASHLDLSESVDAVAKAIAVLKSRGADVKQSLLQVMSREVVPEHAKKALASFLSLSQNAEAGAPEANAYEFQSGGIVDLLEKLKRKFADQRLVLEKEEMNSKASYEVLNQQLTDDIKANKEAVSAKTATKASRLEAAAQAKGDKAVTETTKSEDEKTLSDTNAKCRAKAEEFENNQVVRREELTAISKAIEIISSDKVKGTGEERLPSASLVQTPKKKHAFAQLRSSVNEAPEARQRAIEYLQRQAAKLNSRYLSVVAAHTEADPFVKVKKMIKDLLTKLMEEANSEADHNGYCTTELATNKQTREIKSSEVDELSAKIESETATSSRLSDEITNLADSLSEIKGKRSEATNMRSAEKKSNAKAVQEAKEAQRAVEQAIKVLKDFYEAQSGAALMQDAAADIESMSHASKEPYKGMGSTSGGILGMLEVVLSDFARLETETSEAESQGQRVYDSFMDESSEDAAVKETEKKHKENNRDRADEKNRGLKKELEMTQTELDAAMDYYGKLKTQCVDTGLSYEERKKQREEELVSLQEALKILSGEDI